MAFNFQNAVLYTRYLFFLSLRWGVLMTALSNKFSHDSQENNARRRVAGHGKVSTVK